MKGKPIKTPIQPVRLNPPVKSSQTASLKPIPGQKTQKPSEVTAEDTAQRNE